MPKARHGWHTPDSLAGDEICRPLFLPANEEVQAIVGGALAELTKRWNYEQVGMVTPEEMTEFMTVMLSRWYEEACGTVSPTDTPFWETDDGSDADVQGESDTWYNEISYFIIEAFLATIISPAGAMTFVSTVRRIRLAYLRAGWGGVFEVLVNGDLLTTLDSFHPGTPYGEFFWDFGDNEERTIVIQPTGDHNEDAIEHPEHGGYPVGILRQNIHWRPVAFSGEYAEYDPETGVVQTSPDGETWTDNPQADPRNIDAFPLIETANPRCDAAARMSAAVQQVVGTLIAGVDNADAQSIIALALARDFAYIPGIGLLLLLLSALAVLVIETGAAALHAAFDAFDWDEFTCLLYSVIRDDGYLTGEQYEGFIDALPDHYPDAVQWAVLDAIVRINGRGGFNDAAHERTETGDCSGCPAYSYHEHFYTELLPGTHAGGDNVHFPSMTYAGSYTPTYTDTLCGDTGSKMMGMYNPGFGSYRYCLLVLDLGQDRPINHLKMWHYNNVGWFDPHICGWREDGRFVFDNNSAWNNSLGCQYKELSSLGVTVRYIGIFARTTISNANWIDRLDVDQNNP